MNSDQSMFSEAELRDLVRACDTIRPTPRAQHATTEFREFHGWTLNKLDVLALYLNLYRRVAGGGTFIDAFAGTGYGTTAINGTQRRHDGSTLIAAQSGAFANLHLIERDPDNITALGASVDSLTDTQSSKVTIHPGDCNTVLPRLLADGVLDADKPCFALFDQESTQLRWTTVEALAAWKTYEPPPRLTGRPKKCKAELWILFNTQHALVRMWPTNRLRYDLPLGADTLDHLFGSRDAWYDLWEQGRPSSFLRHRYVERLRDLGYQYVLPQPINDPSTGRTHYHMIHATDHPSAVSFMRWAKTESTTDHGRPQLPGI